ncbi:MAG: hypothetical protein D6696_06125 [Acidobacteria bacterium]|nr:MAG: hypothetical protein D6696_06125 [Acidobacteriota bacterium]
MAEMSNYCKAYEVRQLAAFAGWKPDLDNLAQPEADDPDQPPEPRTALADDDILFLHEDYIVTDGIFRDEHVVFDQVTDEWRAFCRDQLDFAIPEDVQEMIRAAEEEARKAAEEEAAAASAPPAESTEAPAAEA